MLGKTFCMTSYVLIFSMFTGHSILQRSPMPTSVLNPPILSAFLPLASSSSSPISASSPSGPLNLVNPPPHPPKLIQSPLECDQAPSSEDGGDERGVYIPEGEMDESEEIVSQHPHHSPNIDFSASNLAQSSPSPASLHYANSPLNVSDENGSGSSSSGIANAAV